MGSVWAALAEAEMEGDHGLPLTCVLGPVSEVVGGAERARV